jgi:hypothetical protein
MVHCAGCHNNFSVSGYTHHLRFAQSSSSCAAAYHAQVGHGKDSEMEEDGNDNAAFLGEIGDYNDNDNNAAFSGDVFGNNNDVVLDGGMSYVDTCLCPLTIIQVMNILLMSHRLLSAALWHPTHASGLCLFHWPQQARRSLALYAAAQALQSMGVDSVVTRNTHRSAQRSIGT